MDRCGVPKATRVRRRAPALGLARRSSRSSAWPPGSCSPPARTSRAVTELRPPATSRPARSRPRGRGARAGVDRAGRHRCRQQVDRRNTAAGRCPRRRRRRAAAPLGTAARTRRAHGRRRARHRGRPRRRVRAPADGVDANQLVVHQSDLQAVVNALWAGGAEAMTIAGQRVIATSAVRCVGNTLLLNGEVFSPPFRVAAIGPYGHNADALDRSPGVHLFRAGRRLLRPRLHRRVHGSTSSYPPTPEPIDAQLRAGRA